MVQANRIPEGSKVKLKRLNEQVLMTRHDDLYDGVVDYFDVEQKRYCIELRWHTRVMIGGNQVTGLIFNLFCPRDALEVVERGSGEQVRDNTFLYPRLTKER